MQQGGAGATDECCGRAWNNVWRVAVEGPGVDRRGYEYRMTAAGTSTWRSAFGPLTV